MGGRILAMDDCSPIPDGTDLANEAVDEYKAPPALEGPHLVHFGRGHFVWTCGDLYENCPIMVELG